MFSRGMTWLCSILSAVTAVSVMGAVTVTVLISDTNLIPCRSFNANTGGYAQAQFDCHMNTTVVTTVEHRPGGRSVMRTTTATAQPLGAGDFVSLLLLMTPGAVLALALWEAGRFFAQLSKGHALHARTIARLRTFSALGVLLLMINPLAPAANRAVEKALHAGVTTLTWNSADVWGWHPTLADLMNIVFAAVLVSMVSVLARAARIAEDHAQIV